MPLSKDAKAFRRGNLFGVGVETRLDLPLLPEVAAPLIKVNRGDISYSFSKPIHQDDKIRIYKEHPDSVTVKLTNTLLKISRQSIIVDSDVCNIDLLIFFAWPLLLSLLGRESLHGCVVERDGAGVAVLGDSGSGKSTAALRLVELGFRLVADDLVVFNEDFLAVPGPPFIRLRADQAPGQEGEWDQGGKFRCNVPTCPTAVPIKKIIVLDDSFEKIAPVKGAKAADLLVRNLASGYVVFPDQGINRFRFATSVANRIPIIGAKPRSLESNHLKTITESINPVQSCSGGR